ncbi:MAG: hypothetical protein GY814_13950 [Gammaproteobacteria bacterium]|nr:hypothetical protein [Gammaproteobacteria bacterium]
MATLTTEPALSVEESKGLLRSAVAITQAPRKGMSKHYWQGACPECKNKQARQGSYYSGQNTITWSQCGLCGHAYKHIHNGFNRIKSLVKR